MQQRCVRAAENLGNMAALIDAATIDERRALMRILFDRVWVAEKQLTAITPHTVFAHLIDAMTASCVGGVADGLPVPVTEDWRALPIVVGHKQAYTFVRP